MVWHTASKEVQNDQTRFDDFPPQAYQPTHLGLWPVLVVEHHLSGVYVLGLCPTPAAGDDHGGPHGHNPSGVLGLCRHPDRHPGAGSHPGAHHFAPVTWAAFRSRLRGRRPHYVNAGHPVLCDTRNDARRGAAPGDDRSGYCHFPVATPRSRHRRARTDTGPPASHRPDAGGDHWPVRCRLGCLLRNSAGSPGRRYLDRSHTQLEI